MILTVISTLIIFLTTAVLVSNGLAASGKLNVMGSSALLPPFGVGDNDYFWWLAVFIVYLLAGMNLFAQRKGAIWLLVFGLFLRAGFDLKMAGFFDGSFEIVIPATVPLLSVSYYAVAILLCIYAGVLRRERILV